MLTQVTLSWGLYNALHAIKGTPQTVKVYTLTKHHFTLLSMSICDTQCTSPLRCRAINPYAIDSVLVSP